jgi:hypothetical protein
MVEIPVLVLQKTFISISAGIGRLFHFILIKGYARKSSTSRLSGKSRLPGPEMIIPTPI